MDRLAALDSHCQDLTTDERGATPKFSSGGEIGRSLLRSQARGLLFACEHAHGECQPLSRGFARSCGGPVV